MNGSPETPRLDLHFQQELAFQRAQKDEKLLRMTEELRKYWKSQDYPPEMIVNGITPDAQAMANGVREATIRSVIRSLDHLKTALEALL